jgi:hypothetical protein
MKSGVIFLTIALCAFANATEKRLKRTAVSKVRDVVEAVLFGMVCLIIILKRFNLTVSDLRQGEGFLNQ